MMITVGFDDESQLPANEVDDVGTDRLLPTKANTELLPTELLPKEQFGGRHCFPKALGAVLCVSGLVAARHVSKVPLLQ